MWQPRPRYEKGRCVGPYSYMLHPGKTQLVKGNSPTYRPKTSAVVNLLSPRRLPTKYKRFCPVVGYGYLCPPVGHTAGFFEEFMCDPGYLLAMLHDTSM